MQQVRFKKKKTPSKEFSKTLKLFLSDEVSIHPKILVFDNDRLTFNETEIVKAFSNSFENTIKTHDIKKKKKTNDFQQHCQQPQITQLTKLSKYLRTAQVLN